MGAPKGNQNAKGNPGGSGRPSMFKPEHVKMVRLMAAQGWTEIKMAGEIGIDPDTFRRWKAKHVDFLRAATPTDEEKRAAVENSLFHRAIGYDVMAEKIMTVAVGGGISEIVREAYVEHYPPDVNAIKFYLTNRARTDWSERQEVEQSGGVTVRVVGGLPGETGEDAAGVPRLGSEKEKP